MDKIDLMLASAVIAYAALLEALDHKDSIEPDGTWLEVVIGNTLCLMAVMLRVRRQVAAGEDPGWREYEQAVQRAFVVGGLPIILWQLWQAARRKDATIHYLIGVSDDAADTMAQERRDRES